MIPGLNPYEHDIEIHTDAAQRHSRENALHS